MPREITAEQLLAELDDLIRSTPQGPNVRQGLKLDHQWIGRAIALISRWDRQQGEAFSGLVTTFQGPHAMESGQAFQLMLTTLNRARADLRLEVGQLAIAIPAGAVFDYFDELRKIIGTATQDVLFVDQYLDADFVTRYLVDVPATAGIRLLTAENRLASLLSAVDLLMAQHHRKVEVRVSQGMHDRYVLVDGMACYQSGASFKDGAKKAPTTLTQIIDPFPAVRDTYEKMWAAGRVER